MCNDGVVWDQFNTKPRWKLGLNMGKPWIVTRTDIWMCHLQVSQLLSASLVSVKQGRMMWSLGYCCCTHPVTEDDKNADTVWVFFEKEATVQKKKRKEIESIASKCQRSLAFNFKMF